MSQTNKKCRFAVDKNKSLDIIRSIMAKERIFWSDDDEHDDNDIKHYKHNIGLVRIEIDDDSTIDAMTKKIIDTSHYKLDRYSKSGSGKYGCISRGSIDISEIVINDNNLELIAYLHGTSYECDWSYPTFIYNEALQSWIVCDEYILNDVLLLLDFSDYFDNDDNGDCVKKMESDDSNSDESDSG